MSKDIRQSKIWEELYVHTLAKALEVHGKGSVFLDAGANIGTYSLYMAARGHRVWAVEPMEMHANLVKSI